MSLVLLVAAVAGTSAYFYTSENEQDSFEARVSISRNIETDIPRIGCLPSYITVPTG